MFHSSWLEVRDSLWILVSNVHLFHVKCCLEGRFEKSTPGSLFLESSSSICVHLVHKWLLSLLLSGLSPSDSSDFAFRFSASESSAGAPHLKSSPHVPRRHLPNLISQIFFLFKTFLFGNLYFLPLDYKRYKDLWPYWVFPATHPYKTLGICWKNDFIVGSNNEIKCLNVRRQREGCVCSLLGFVEGCS